MSDTNAPLAALAGGVGAGLGTTVPLIFEFEGAVALLAAIAAGAMTAGLCFVAVSTGSSKEQVESDI